MDTHVNDYISCLAKNNDKKNQNNQKIKTIKDFDSFDSLINWDGVHTSYLTSTKVSVQRFIEVNPYVHKSF